MLQVGVVVMGGGGGVTAVLVDLIQAPDAKERCVELMAALPEWNRILFSSSPEANTQKKISKLSVNVCVCVCITVV